jgi:hypothetical protein
MAQLARSSHARRHTSTWPALALAQFPNPADGCAYTLAGREYPPERLPNVGRKSFVIYAGKPLVAAPTPRDLYLPSGQEHRGNAPIGELQWRDFAIQRPL